MEVENIKMMENFELYYNLLLKTNLTTEIDSCIKANDP